MVKVLALLLSLLATPVLAQGSFVTIVSPSTLTVSETGTPNVNCVSGCGGAGTVAISPAAGTSAFTVSLSTLTTPTSATGVTLIVPFGTISTSATGLTTIANSPLAVQVTSLFGGTLTVSQAAGVAAVNVTNTPTVSPSGVATISGAVTINNPSTLTVSPTGVLTTSGTATVTQGTSPWSVNVQSLFVGTVNVSQAAGVAAVNVTNTPTVSQAAGVLATNVTNTVTASLTNNSVVSLATATVPVSINNVPNVTVGNTITASLATSSYVDTVSQDQGSYSQKGNWVSGSQTTTVATMVTVIKAPVANKLYITGIQCGRTDPGTGVPIKIEFNAGTSSTYVIVPPTSSAAVNNVTFNPPVATSATTSLNMVPSVAVSSLWCNAQGYNAP